MRPRVSVIIPTHNRAALLAQALDSVFAQEGVGTEFDLDVVVVDDASTDDTAEVVARYSSARRIRLSQRGGAGHARNVGVEETTGRFVAFLDDDDLWLPKKLWRQVGALKAAPESGVAYSQLFIGSPRGYVFPEHHAPSGALFQHLLFVNLCVMPAVLVLREALTSVGCFRTGPLEDYELWLRLARCVPFLFVPGIVAIYRYSEGGSYLTAVRTGEQATALRRIVEEALATLPPTEESERIKREARATIELRTAVSLIAVQLTARAWEYVRAALEIDPAVMRNSRNRASIASIAGQHAASLPSPLATAHRLWRELRSALGENAARQPAEMKRLLADVYWEVASAQRAGVNHRASMVGAAYAAARSLCVDPLDLRKWGMLMRFLGRPFSFGAARSAWG